MNPTDTGRSACCAILISDLANFTDFSRRMTASSLHELMSEYFKMVRKIIAKRQGTVVKTLGDGVLSYFPLRDSTKNDDRTEAVLSAVKVAIEMKLVDSHLNSRRLAGNATQRFPEISVRVAIHFGVISIGPIIGDNEDIMGSHVNLTSRILSLIGNRPRENFDTEPIILSDMAAKVVNEKLFLVDRRFNTDNIKGFGALRVDLVEVINLRNGQIGFSDYVRSGLKEVRKQDSFTGVNIQQPVYGPFQSQERHCEEIFVDYSFDLQRYEDSQYVLLQLPLMATGAGRKGASEKWKSIYYVNNGKEYMIIAQSGGVVFDEPKPFEYAPCIDLKEREKERIFSLDCLRDGKLRIYMTLWNDGRDTFFIQPECSRRWRRLYLGVAYI